MRKSSEIRKKACLKPKILEPAGDSLSTEPWEETEERDEKILGREKDKGEEWIEEGEIMEVESSTGITESEREIAPRTKEIRSSVRKKKRSRIIISSGVEEEEFQFIRRMKHLGKENGEVLRVNKEGR